MKENKGGIRTVDATYDCIVVGAGTSAMGFLRGLLEQEALSSSSVVRRIAVVEQGSTPVASSRRMLQAWYPDAHTSVLPRQARMGSRRIRIPVGKGRGGTTTINAGLCTSFATTDSRLQQAMDHLREVLREKGVYQASPVPTVVHSATGRRVDYFQGLVESMLLSSSSSSNSSSSVQVEWIDGATCRRILGDETRQGTGKVTGVEYESENGQTTRIFAPRVVLAAGVWASPAILVASGFLSADTRFSVQDHVMIPAVFWGRPPQHAALTEPPWNGVASLECIRWNDDYAFHVSQMDASVFSGILPALAVDYLFHRTEWDRLRCLTTPISIMIAWLLRLLSTWTPLAWFLQKHITVVGVFLVQSPSRYNGSFAIRRGDQDNCVVDNIRLDYLRSPEDLQAVTEFWSQHISRRFGSSKECLPGRLVRSGLRLDQSLHPERFRIYCQQLCLPYFHWSGSLSERRDPLPLGLTVCDASTLHPLPPVPPALVLAARGYVLAQEFWQQENKVD